jgi:hypothetical protein
MTKGAKIAIGIAIGIVLIGGCNAIAKNGQDDTPAPVAAAAKTTPAAPPPPVSSAPAGDPPKSSQPPAPKPSPSKSKPGPAQMLADLDGDKHPASDYQQVLDQLTPKCTQDEYTVASYVYATLEDLRKNNITDETELTVLQHLNGSLPGGSGKTDCQSIAAAYLVLREQ